MKKSIIKAGLAAALGAVSLSALARQPITVTINGRAIQFNGAQPQEVNGRVLVPLRGVFENMGASVHWTSATQTVDAQKGNTTVELQIGNHAAHVNGSEVNLDVPPELMNDTTLVPLRFISEALGADVDWLDAQQTVAIRVHGPDEHYRPPAPPVVVRPPVVHRAHWRAMFHINMVIAATLDTPLSSDHSQQGDSFSVTVDTHGAPGYRGLPRGSHILGHVENARPRDGNHPGILELEFDRIVLPDGTSVGILGRLIGLDNQSIIRGRDGTLVANPRVDRDGKAAFIGYGAAAGAVFGIVTNGHIAKDAVVGGALGALMHDMGRHPERAQNVYVPAGTQLGVRIMREADVP